MAVFCDCQHDGGVLRERADRIHVATIPADIGKPAKYSGVCLDIDCFDGGRERKAGTTTLFDGPSGSRRRRTIHCFVKQFHYSTSSLRLATSASGTSR